MELSRARRLGVHGRPGRRARRRRPSAADKSVADARVFVFVLVVRAEAHAVESAADEPGMPYERGTRAKPLASARGRRRVCMDERGEPARPDEQLAHHALRTCRDEHVVPRDHGVGKQVRLPKLEISSHALVLVVSGDPEQGNGKHPVGGSFRGRRDHDLCLIVDACPHEVRAFTGVKIRSTSAGRRCRSDAGRGEVAMDDCSISNAALTARQRFGPSCVGGALDAHCTFSQDSFRGGGSHPACGIC